MEKTCSISAELTSELDFKDGTIKVIMDIDMYENAYVIDFSNDETKRLYETMKEYYGKGKK